MLKSLYVFYTLQHAQTRLSLISINLEAFDQHSIKAVVTKKKNVYGWKSKFSTSPDNHNEQLLSTFYVVH